MLVGISLFCNFALDLPKDRTRPPWPPPINNRSKKMINKIGKILKSKDTKSDCFGTLISQPAAGGLLVSNSTINASWPATYDASIFADPSTNSPSFKITCTF